MYKKPAQPPTPNINQIKKSTKMTERTHINSVDKKNDTTNNDFKNKDQQLLSLVKEFLQFNGYIRTFQTLKHQRPNLKAKVLNQPVNKNQLDKNILLQLFDKGNREQFFKQTARLLAATDESIKKLEFELHLYFCIYNIHPNLKKLSTVDKPSSEAFKKYLETKGADLSNTSQFLSYFAIPYVQKPQENPQFAHIFTKDWITKLRNKLVQFLSIYLKSSNTFNQSSNNSKKMSFLQQMYYNSVSTMGTSRDESKQNGNYSIEIQSLKQQNNELRIIIDNYQKKFEQFAESSKLNLIQSNQKWFYFSREIFMAARKYIREDKVKLIERYNSFFGGNIQEHIEANQISLFDKNSYNQDLSITPDLSKQRIAIKKPEHFNQNTQIDLQKIKNLYMQAHISQKETQICLVLKALKQRFAKKSEHAQRRQIIIEYSRGDICGIDEQSYILQKKLLFDGGQKIKLLYIKLMEIITTDGLGLQYLTKSKKLIQNLVSFFNNWREQGSCRKPILGILQRFSFSKQPRMLMIKLGIIQIIFNIFKTEGSQLSDFNIQFLIAMMMNLSLKKESKADFQKNKEELIQIIIEQMSSENDHIRNYVNGTIFLLLTSKQIKNEALKQKLDVVVKKLVELKEDNMCVQQYNYILNRLSGEEEQDIYQQSDSEEEEQAEVEEQFQDEDDYGQLSESSTEDFIEGDIQIANGEDLLLKNYALLGPQAVREQILNRSVLDQTSKRLNNMTTSINKSRRLDNIFVLNQKNNATVLQPQLLAIINKKK